MACAALSACSGQGDSGAESSQDYRFKAQAQRQADLQAASTNPNELSSGERDEVQARSLEWGAASLLSPRLNTVNGPVLLPGNGATIPALHFGRAFTLQAAAQGDTLAALVAATPAPSSPAVAAALQGGLQRTVSPGENTILTSAFLDSVTASRWPGALTSLTLQPLSDAQLQARAVQLNHQLRASVEDRATGLWPWPQVTRFQAAWHERNANLRGLDGGGAFARLFAATASSSAAEVGVSLTAAGLGYSGMQGVDFIFSPLNNFGGNSYGSGYQWVDLPGFATPPACPATTVALRPIFLAVLHANGNLALLTRLSSFNSSPCVKP